MFKDKYRRAIDTLTPSQEQLDGLKAMAEGGKLIPKRHIANRRLWYRLGAAAACAALVFALYKPLTGYFSGDADANGGSPREASSYAEIYRLFKSSSSHGKGKDLADYQDDNWNLAPAEDSTGSVDGRETAQQYSGTNLQVAGVDESDIVKTDGKYIYAVTDEYIHIISAQNGQLEPVSKVSRYIYQDDALKSRAFELYIREGRLIVLKEIAVGALQSYGSDDAGDGRAAPDYDPVAPAAEIPEKDYYKDYYKYHINGQTAISAEIYDITDIANPKALNSIGQSGYLISSRMVGDTLYLITNYAVYGDIKKSQPETYIPKIYKNGEDSLVGASDILYNPDAQYYAYTVISGIDTSGSGEMVSVKTVLGYGSTVYSNGKNLYLASPDTFSETMDGYITGYNLTNIVKFSLDNGSVSFAADGSVPGSILNQFAMDEFDGVFRIVTTVYRYKYPVTDNGVVEGVVRDSIDDAISYDTPDSTSDSGSTPPDSIDPARPSDTPAYSDPDSGTWNALYTLDGNLNIIGKIENLAPGETVYSVRFSGSVGYFVTFRQIDPLFAVNLSNPENPTLLGELKIPGFSNYLHPYGNGLLFGLGMDADKNTGMTGSMKLSMFDVSDPAAVSEKHSLVLDGFYYSAASYNHRAILIDPAKNLIGFQADAYYLIYSYDANKGFTELARLPLYESSAGYYIDIDARGLYIGDFLYLISQKQAVSFSLGAFTPVDTLAFGG